MPSSRLARLLGAVYLVSLSSLAGCEAEGSPAPKHPPGSLFRKLCAAEHLDELANAARPPGPARQLTYGLDQLIDKAKNQNLTVRINAERVYQAREKIKGRVGRLLPQLRLSTMLSVIDSDYAQLTASLIGFVFPSHWYDWRESRLFFEAERRSHAALLANEVHMVTVLFYEVSLIKHLLVTYHDSISEVTHLLAIAYARAEAGEDRIDRTIRIENIKELLESDAGAIEVELHKLVYTLAFAVSEPVELWTSLDIDPVDLPTPDELVDLDDRRTLASAYEHSFELEEIDYLILAARYSVKKRSFEFLTPGGDEETTLGLGYFSHLRIGKSAALQLQLKREQMANQVSLAVYKTLRDYRSVREAYRKGMAGLTRTKRLYEFLLRKAREGGEYEVDEFVEALETLLLYKTRLAHVGHQILTTRTLLDRLMLRGKAYAGLLALTPEKPYKNISLSKVFENLRIARALKKGHLILPKKSER